MKILVDEQIPEAAVVALRGGNHQVKRAKKGNSDENILTQAKDGDRMLLTFDSDFRNLSKDKGYPKKGIVLFTNIAGIDEKSLAKIIIEGVAKYLNLGSKLVEIPCKKPLK